LNKRKQRSIVQELNSHSLSKTSSQSSSRYLPKQVKAESKKSKRSSIGMIAITALLSFCAFYLLQNLFVLQILEHEKYAQAASENQYRRIVELPIRGSIYDRNGKQLAFSSPVETVGITPSDVRSRKNTEMKAEEIAEGIAQSLGLSTQEVLHAMGQIDKQWVLLKRRVEKIQTDSLKSFISEHEIGGVRFDKEQKRVYPQGNIAGEIIGFVNPDGVGQLGVEWFYNREMTGDLGYTYAETDNYGKAALPFAIPISLRAKNGYNISLTIDVEIQKILMDELQKSIEIYNISEGAVAIVMDPYTGGVLGMANTPGFDPSNPTAAPDGIDKENWDPSKKETIDYLQKFVWRNKAIGNTYEPGSTFKILTAAMAMEEGKFFEKENMSNAPIKVADRVIGNLTSDYTGLSTAEEAFWRSSNPVFVQFSQRVGLSKYYHYVRGFGFYTPTGIDLPGEGTGIFHSNPTLLDMACLAFGEQSTVTPIAMLNAFCAFANGGSLMKPQIARNISDTEGNIINNIAPETIRQIVSEETAERIKKLLKGVVLYGTGSKGYVEGYSVGGKTSTSTRDDGLNDISFIAMSPVEQPVICILVIMFGPDKEYARSSLAALTSAKMTSRILEYMGIVREYSQHDVSLINQKFSIPELTGKTFIEAKTILQAMGFHIEDPLGNLSNQTKILAQFPTKGVEMHKGATVSVYSSENPNQVMVAVPNIIGKSVHECMRTMTEYGINIIIEGDCLGNAITQEFESGTMVAKRSVMKVGFSDRDQSDE
jgi:stage V sporulation protein D (sporulation-specific penicillin-binding protein)